MMISLLVFLQSNLISELNVAKEDDQPNINDDTETVKQWQMY